MTAICYNGPISAVPTDEQLLGEKEMCEKLHIDMSKTVGHVLIDSAHHAVHLYAIYILYMIPDVSFWVPQTIILCSGYNKKLFS